MPKVLFVTTVDVTLRGFLLPFANHFRAKGWEVDAMSAGVENCQQCRASFDRVWEVDWSRNPSNLANLLSAPRAICKVVSEGGYDVVHVHTPIAAFVSRFALRRLRKQGHPKIIYTAHGFHFFEGGSPLKNAVFLGLEKLAGCWTDYLVVINQEDFEASKRHRIVPPERLHYMPGIGVDTAKYASERVSQDEIAKVRAEIGLTSGDPLILMIAEFNPGKRHRDALAAFAQLGSSTAHLAFAGPGRLMDEMRSLAKELGVADRVHFLGFRRDIPTLIKASIVTVLPSEREGLPRSAMESLSLGVPVIGTDIRGVRDLISDDCGILVKVGDVAGLAKAMDWILSHPIEAQLMGETGRVKMKANFDIAAIIKAHESLYDEALGLEPALIPQ